MERNLNFQVATEDVEWLMEEKKQQEEEKMRKKEEEGKKEVTRLKEVKAKADQKLKEEREQKKKEVEEKRRAEEEKKSVQPGGVTSLCKLGGNRFQGERGWGAGGARLGSGDVVAISSNILKDVVPDPKNLLEKPDVDSSSDMEWEWMSDSDDSSILILSDKENSPPK